MSQDKKLARTMQGLFASPALRVNTSTDVVGVEICGALKNVLAIAAGIVEGLDLGHNAMAALIAQVCAPPQGCPAQPCCGGDMRAGVCCSRPRPFEATLVAPCLIPAAGKMILLENRTNFWNRLKLRVCADCMMSLMMKMCSTLAQSDLLSWDLLGAAGMLRDPVAG